MTDATKKRLSSAVLDEAAAGKAMRIGGALALLGLGLAVGLGVGEGDHFHRLLYGYLLAFVTVLSVALGALFFVTLQHLTRAGWSVIVRRVAEGLADGMGALALLAVPLVVAALMGSHAPFSWAAPNAHDRLLDHKAPYLDPTFFAIRMAVYFVAWVGLGRFFLKTSLAQDDSGEPALTLKNEKVSAPAMVIFALTVTFASFDLLMSLEPHWFSTIIGVYYFAGCLVAFLAVMVLLTMGLRRAGKLPGMSVEHDHDLGKLLYGFNFFWAYIAFSQYMLIWYGDIPEETQWYLPRQQGPWLWVSLLLIVGHFALPFVGFMSRWVKRKPASLAFWAAWLLAMHVVDMIYVVGPAARPHGAETAPLHLGGIEMGALVGIAGAYAAFVAYRLRGKRLVPIKDPRLSESLALENF